jgi:hypothetical protein
MISSREIRSCTLLLFTLQGNFNTLGNPQLMLVSDTLDPADLFFLLYRCPSLVEVVELNSRMAQPLKTSLT